VVEGFEIIEKDVSDVEVLYEVKLDLFFFCVWFDCVLVK